jgi:two-component system, sensor histidine kinase
MQWICKRRPLLALNNPEIAVSEDLIARNVRAAGVHGVFATLPSALFSTLVAAAFACAVVADATPTHVWAIWLAAVYGLLLIRAAGLMAFRRAQPEGAALPRWGWLATFGSASSAVLWGAAPYWLVPESAVAPQLVIAIVVAVLATTSAFASATHKPAFFAFYLPTMPPLMLLLLMADDRPRQLLGGMLVFYIPIFIGFYFRMHQAFLATQRLAIEKEVLSERLAERNRAVEDANAAKSTFLAAASHDLRQPLHALSLFVETLRARPLAETERRLVDNIGHAAGAMDEMFNALLDVSKLDAGAVEPAISVFPAQQVLDHIALAFTGPAAAKGLQLRIRPSRAWLKSDPVLVEEALRNLVANAVRYTKRGGILVTCRVRASQNVFEVIDTGFGIAPDHLRLVFREFVQVGNAERNRENGLGLGLAIVERLARLLGGSVAVKSKLDRGSCFRLTIPGATESEAGTQTLELVPPASSQRFDGVKVFVLDDEPQVRLATAGLLQAWGATVVDADSAAALVQRAAASGIERPDLIIADYRLQGPQSGVDAITQLREEWNADIPALILTGDTSAERIRHFSEVGHTFLTKPVRANDLRAMLAALLRATDGH